MSEKYKNKYRTTSARLQNWDYGWAGAYFITICTRNRNHFFGEIKNGKMILSQVGVLADVFLSEIKNHSHNTQLGEYVVMPNHIHVVLILNGNDGVDSVRDGDGMGDDGVRDGDGMGDDGVRDGDGMGDDGVRDGVRDGDSKDKACLVSIVNTITKNDNEHNDNGDNKDKACLVSPDIPITKKTPGQKRYQNQGKNTVSSIIGSYKSAVTRHANRLGYEFGWQPKFYDNVIRDGRAFDNISNYIINNPAKWEEDKFNKP